MEKSIRLTPGAAAVTSAAATAAFSLPFVFKRNAYCIYNCCSHCCKNKIIKNIHSDSSESHNNYSEYKGCNPCKNTLPYNNRTGPSDTKLALY